MSERLKVWFVNDCSYVSETIIRYLPKSIETRHIKRARGWFDKTAGIAYKILSAGPPSIWHCAYLLQDCYLVNKLKRQPVVGHAHGSDVRSSLHHKIWGEMVKHNLKECDKILVSTPDILDKAEEYNPTAEYLPNPVDPRIFHPKPPPKNATYTILYASDMSYVKGTEILIEAFNKFEKFHPNARLVMIRYGAHVSEMLYKMRHIHPIKNLELIPKRTHEQMSELYRKADVVVSDLKLGVLTMVSLEAMACARPVVQHLNKEVYDVDIPVVKAKKPDEVCGALEKLTSPRERAKYAHRGARYVDRHHNPDAIVKRVLKIYDEVLGEAPSDVRSDSSER